MTSFLTISQITIPEYGRACRECYKCWQETGKFRTHRKCCDQVRQRSDGICATRRCDKYVFSGSDGKVYGTKLYCRNCYSYATRNNGKERPLRYTQRETSDNFCKDRNCRRWRAGHSIQEPHRIVYFQHRQYCQRCERLNREQGRAPQPRYRTERDLQAALDYGELILNVNIDPDQVKMYELGDDPDEPQETESDPDEGDELSSGPDEGEESDHNPNEDEEDLVENDLDMDEQVKSEPDDHERPTSNPGQQDIISVSSDEDNETHDNHRTNVADPFAPPEPVAQAELTLNVERNELVADGSAAFHIQGLVDHLDQRDRRIQELEAENERVSQESAERIQELEAEVERLRRISQQHEGTQQNATISRQDEDSTEQLSDAPRKRRRRE